jgi:hypothetical protein
MRRAALVQRAGDRRQASSDSLLTGPLQERGLVLAMVLVEPLADRDGQLCRREPGEHARVAQDARRHRRRQRTGQRPRQSLAAADEHPLPATLLRLALHDRRDAVDEPRDPVALAGHSLLALG